MNTPALSPPTIAVAAAERWSRQVQPASPWLHEEVARRMLERLPLIRRQPQNWAHWGVLQGGLQSHRQLSAFYPQARCRVVEATPAQVQQARQRLAQPWWKPASWSRAALHFDTDQPPENSVDLVWANMQLHLSAQPQRLLARWQQALAAEGFLMFSCLGPDTVRELHNLYQRLGWPPCGHAHTDMHDWGDMLVQAGFAEPVMDMERLTLTYSSPSALIDDLRGIGRNLHPQRFPALRGRGWRARLEQAIAEHLHLPHEPGRLGLSFEVIYGHAMKAATRLKVQPEATVSLAQMRAALARGRPA